MNFSTHYNAKEGQQLSKRLRSLGYTVWASRTGGSITILTDAPKEATACITTSLI